MPTDRRRVFVVHGRNESLTRAMFEFLRALGLDPQEWSELLASTGEATPYIGNVLDKGLKEAQAVVVLMSPDEVAYLYGHSAEENESGLQARPNVLFEAGMAFALKGDKTILVEFGDLREISDLAGRHVVRMDNSTQKRNELAARLETAGCSVQRNRNHWHDAGDFSLGEVISSEVALGIRAPKGSPSSSAEVNVVYERHGKDGRLRIANTGSVDLTDVRLLSDDPPGFFIRKESLPVPRLPAGKSTSLQVITMMGDTSYFDAIVGAVKPDGAAFEQTIFVDLP